MACTHAILGRRKRVSLRRINRFTVGQGGLQRRGTIQLLTNRHVEEVGKRNPGEQERQDKEGSSHPHIHTSILNIFKYRKERIERTLACQ